ncbi:SIT4 phosphatase-associated protein-domain-containing protein [Yarrowia lipolytica]|nr:SIT4-associating protein [Yarrowia lipolytica]RDW34001.1 SIT4 phosphatase-associated protein-domain-containing protein [Yarrowia lipolytica]SEI32216.1 YALIA101S02e12266g1_1 [Yarrowia lipolytica]
MSFWRMGSGFSSVSVIDKILDNPDHTLHELLEEPDLLQEVLNSNAKLTEYLRRDDILEELVQLVKGSPESSKEEGQGEGEGESEGFDDKKPNSEEDKDKKDDCDNDNDVEMADSDDKEQPKEEEEPKQGEQATDAADPDKDDEDSDTSFDSTSSDPSKYKLEEEDQQHYASVASEILSAEVWSLTEALMEREELVQQIWEILDYPAPLSMNQAQFFTKISEHLLDKKTDDMIAFIKRQSNFVERFMRHIDDPPLMDFLLKVISTDKADNSTGIIDFLQKQRLIPSLIAFLGPDVPSYIQSAAGDFVKAFVTMSANSNSDNSTIGPNELSRELVSEPVVREFVRLMLFGGTGLATGVGIIIEIIRKNNSDYDYMPVLFITMKTHPPGPRDPIYLGTLVRIFSQHIPEFQAMLTRPSNKTLKTPIGDIEPLGFERFKICELVAELLHCSNMTLLNDPKGETIVAERDAERERVKQVIAKANEDGGDIDFARLSVSNEDEENEEQNEEEEGEAAKADAEEAKADSAETKAESEAVETEDKDDSLEAIEAALRKDPVVGDLLKISLVDNDVIVTILNMFMKFPWNNFLHNVVFDIVQQILNGPMGDGFNRFLAINLFDKGQLTQLIVDGQQRCDEYETEHGTRIGYMGHLTLISEEVVKFTAVFTPESISPVVAAAVTVPEWIMYVAHTLVKTREQHNALLGGARPDHNSVAHNPDAIILGDGAGNELGEEEAEDDERDGGVVDVDEDAKEDNPDQFSRYMSQQITGDMPDRFGSSDEDDEDDVWEERKFSNDLKPFHTSNKKESSDEDSDVSEGEPEVEIEQEVEVEGADKDAALRSSKEDSQKSDGDANEEPEKSEDA